jgi:hypothetical protein
MAAVKLAFVSDEFANNEAVRAFLTTDLTVISVLHSALPIGLGAVCVAFDEKFVREHGRAIFEGYSTSVFLAELLRDVMAAAILAEAIR